MPNEAVDPAEIARAHHPPQAVAYVPDLIDRSKVAAAIDDVHFVGRPDALVGCRAPLVIVDLGRPGVVDVLASVRSARVVGFAAHVDTDTLAAARAAGCEALRRSEFFAGLPALFDPRP